METFWEDLLEEEILEGQVLLSIGAVSPVGSSENHSTY